MNRSTLIRKAANLSKGDPARREILATLSADRSAATSSSGTIELRYIEGRQDFRLTARRLFGSREIRELLQMADVFERDVLGLIATVGTNGSTSAVRVGGFAQGAYLELYASGTPSVPDESFYASFNKAARARGFYVK